jgi:hypothetical protein
MKWIQLAYSDSVRLYRCWYQASAGQGHDKLNEAYTIEEFKNNTAGNIELKVYSTYIATQCGELLGKKCLTNK